MSLSIGCLYANSPPAVRRSFRRRRICRMHAHMRTLIRTCTCVAPRRTRRAAALCLSLVLSITMFPACGRATPPTSAVEVLVAMREADPTLPAGAIYDRAAPTETPTHLGDTLLSALYGSAINALILPENTVTTTVPPPRKTVASPQVEIAVFLAEALHPGEIAVFRCPDARTVAAAAALCRTRLDTIRRGWSDSDYASLTARGTVVVEGSYVLLVVAEDPESILTAARRAIKE